MTETIEVAAVSGETINRTSGELARVVDSTQVQNPALNARNYLQLATLIPGSALTDFNPLAATTGAQREHVGGELRCGDDERAPARNIQLGLKLTC